MLYIRFKKCLKKILPLDWYYKLAFLKENIKGEIWGLLYPGDERFCPFCGKSYGKFMPCKYPYGITEKADIISAQTIDNLTCPNCFSKDRQRALYFYFQQKNISFANKKILHFAPELSLYSLISPQNPAEYICGDIEPKAYSHISQPVRKLDIINIDLPSDYFDIVICNHVLEHIEDDIKAMKELFRVLKKGGLAVLLVPIGANLEKTYEDASKITEEERAEAFGQSDHIRIYSEKGYLERLSSVGFAMSAENARLSPEEIFKYAINHREKLYIGDKN